MEDKVFPNVPDPLSESDPQDLNKITQSMGEITNVEADTSKFIRKNYFKRVLVGGIIFGILEAFWLVYIISSGNVNAVDLFVASIPFLVAIIAYANIKNKVEDAFMAQFAALNGFVYRQTGLPVNLDGVIFSLGHSAGGRDIISGNFQDFPLIILNYHYTVGSGKSAQTYNLTVFRLDYPDVLPPIFLQVKWHNFGEGVFGSFSKNDPEKIQLEGDFNQFFTLYTKKGFETETLEIFAPDFMEKIQDEWKNFSLEFVNNHIYIYACKIISTKVELDNMYSLARYLIAKIGPLADRMKSDIVAMDGYFGKK